MQAPLQGGQLHYFRHEPMRYFAETVLGRRYEEASDASPSTFGFDAATRTIWRPSDVLTPLAMHDSASHLGDARRVAAWAVRWLRGRGLPEPLFRIPRLGACGLVVHPRDTALVAVQRWPARVCKVVADARYASIVENERTAARIAPELAPAVLGFAAPRDAAPGYVMLEYVPDVHPLGEPEFADGLRQITRGLVAAYRTAGVSAVDGSALEQELRTCREQLTGLPPTPFVMSAMRALDTLRVLVERNARERRPLYRTFVHGDIQRSNLRRGRRGMALIDWATGGSHSILFDPFIVELFSPTPAIWPDILAMRPFDVAQGFRGWLAGFLREFAATTGIHLAPTDVAPELIASLCEKTIAIITRHAAVDELRGLRSLGRIERLLSFAGT